VNLAMPDVVDAARLLMLVFAGVTVLGTFIARGASWGIGRADADTDPHTDTDTHTDTH
jgi:hypothetical protein